jgi:hypothetical protein
MRNSLICRAAFTCGLLSTPAQRNLRGGCVPVALSLLDYTTAARVKRSSLIKRNALVSAC